MQDTGPRYSADQTVRLAEELYQKKLSTLVEAKHRGRYIAIDVNTGDYEVGDNYHIAAHTLLGRKPDSPVAVLRIGYPVVGRIGGRVRAGLP